MAGTGEMDTRGYAITHGKVLYETGAYPEGLEVMESVKDFFGGKVSDFNEHMHNCSRLTVMISW